MKCILFTNAKYDRCYKSWLTTSLLLVSISFSNWPCKHWLNVRRKSLRFTISNKLHFFLSASFVSENTVNFRTTLTDIARKHIRSFKSIKFIAYNYISTNDMYKESLYFFYSRENSTEEITSFFQRNLLPIFTYFFRTTFFIFFHVITQIIWFLVRLCGKAWHILNFLTPL